MVALRDDFREVVRTVAEIRGRVHDLESDKAAVKMLAETIKEMPMQMQSIAREAARQALAASTTERRSLIGVRAQVASLAVGCAGVGMMIATAVTTH